MHCAYQYTDKCYSHGDILEQMPTLTEEYKANYEDDHRIHVVTEGSVQYLSIFYSPVEQPPIRAEKNRCRDEEFHQLAVPERRQQLLEPPGADEEQPGEHHAHDYPHAEDEHGVKCAEQIPIYRLQAPNQVTQQQGKQGFLRAGQGKSSFLDKTYGGAGLGTYAYIGGADAEFERGAVLEIVAERLSVVLALPGYLHALAAADEVTLARARGAHRQTADVVDDGDIRREEEQIGEGHLHAGVVVHVLGAVFVGVVEAVVVVVLKAGGLEAVVANFGVSRLIGALVGRII